MDWGFAAAFIPVVGGLVGVIYRSGRMVQKLDDLARKMECLKSIQQEIEENRQRIVVIETKLENRRSHAEA